MDFDIYLFHTSFYMDTDNLLRAGQTVSDMLDKSGDFFFAWC